MIFKEYQSAMFKTRFVSKHQIRYMPTYCTTSKVCQSYDNQGTKNACCPLLRSRGLTFVAYPFFQLSMNVGVTGLLVRIWYTILLQCTYNT